MEAKMALAETRLALEEFLQTRDPADLDAIEEEYRKELEHFDVYVTAILEGAVVEGKQVVATDNDEIRAAVAEMDQNHAQFQESASELMTAHRDTIAQALKVAEAMARLDAAGEEADRLLDQVEEAAGEEMAVAKADGAAGRQSAVTAMIGVTIAAVVLGIVIGLLLSRAITRPFQEIFRGLKTFSRVELKETSDTFNRIIEGMTDGISQVDDAARQVSAASQQLAEGASEQASSLEQTSSALEQMAAMTRTNASNAKEANELANQAHKSAEDGDKTMVAINESSSQISKIIKVIEEIAFQTNLLALNAAVEAARAGEHGKGFAVVADEVRNLAQRAAQAARETTGLIDNAVCRSKDGTDAIQGIVTGVTKVTELLNGIAQASDEQAQGVDQVNTAVSQMDKVTQQNASGAEESASAAEQLSAQAGGTKALVDELIVLVRGEQSSDSRAPVRKIIRSDTLNRRLNIEVAHLKRQPSGAQAEPVSATISDKPGSSEQFMSLSDDGNFKDF
jgi:methyl-accepting chemotaxis protein